MKTSAIYKILALLVLFTSCKAGYEKKKANGAQGPIYDMHQSRTSLDWNGIYTGTLPCADCEGIKTVIQLNNDLTFISLETYLGKNNSTTHKGTFSWNKAGNTITLKSADNTKRSYFVGENTLTHLDNEGQRITGSLANHYVLQKRNITFTETRWKLVELRGKKIEDSRAFVIFKNDKNQVYGNGGCNNFNGTYELKEGNRILLSKLATTLMACPSMEVENIFLPILELADNYSLNGNSMTLNKARMAPLAKFEADLAE